MVNQSQSSPHRSSWKESGPSSPIRGVPSARPITLAQSEELCVLMLAQHCRLQLHAEHQVVQIRGHVHTLTCRQRGVGVGRRIKQGCSQNKIFWGSMSARRFFRNRRIWADPAPRSINCCQKMIYSLLMPNARTDIVCRYDTHSRRRPEHGYS